MMKGKFFIYMAFCSAMCWSACSGDADAPSDKQTEDIRVSAVVEEVKMMSRSAGEDAYTGTVPSPDKELNAAVWFSLTSGSYPEASGTSEYNLPVHTGINFKSGTATFPDELTEEERPKYPTDGSPVYCVGFYPNTGWELVADDATKATHAITGKQDLMFAPEITGSWDSHFSTQHYRHLLTWLKVCVCTTTAEAGSYWGKLQKITLNDVPTSLTVDLTKKEKETDADPEFVQKNAVAFSEGTEGKADIPILNNAEGIELALTTQDVASVFCHPSNKYYLDIECENGTAMNVEVQLKPLTNTEEELKKLEYPAGLQYVLILYFHPFNVVDGVCTLQEWNAQNEDLYPDPVTP